MSRFLLCAFWAGAQEQGSIGGKVADAKGNPVPAATVRLLAGELSQAMTLTDVDGSFVFLGLGGDAYRLAAKN